jgi:hypothetical protein
MFHATFNNIAAISWRPVLVMEEAGVPGENHRPWASFKSLKVSWIKRLLISETSNWKVT